MMRAVDAAIALALGACSSSTGLEGRADALVDASPDEDVAEPSGPCDDYVGQATREEIALTPREDTNLEQLALSVSGGLVADEEIADRVVRDVGGIRALRPDIAHVGYFAWDDGKTLVIHADAATAGAMLDGSYAAWLCPNEWYVVEGVRSLFDSYVILEFKGIYDIERLSLEYGELPGVISAEPDAVVGDGPTIDLTIDGDSYRYVFDDAGGDCPAGCTEHRYVCFTTTSSAPPEFCGEW